MSTTAADLDSRFAALAHPARRAILARLKKGEATVTELARPFAMSQPAITKHLRVLENAGLIERGRDAQRRPCRLQPNAIKDVAEWAESYREFWEQSYDRLEEYLEEMKAKQKKERRKNDRKKR
ncbi:MAG TPA: metalloregulator ArsR/SmtB family transcription factor [Actinomycetota bacterium]|nr:metalloregulator ArsR/SmtB family transcription factor [Actinomycetota bacterium]